MYVAVMFTSRPFLHIDQYELVCVAMLIYAKTKVSQQHIPTLWTSPSKKTYLWVYVPLLLPFAMNLFNLFNITDSVSDLAVGNTHYKCHYINHKYEQKVVS